ncbi:hypothetical protein Pmani_013940 [Petrolisthes manimaculis]|uniref:Oxidized purine nucleoside triphosphate hydrolase n=1 Tax=Petrolisthes manimaculis TaxID=1843537 RepID=A0AAE1UDL9_9EUCA|nr:hypothetical protein Pmani_013940 [Petrolisthes manimaculis]
MKNYVEKLFTLVLIRDKTRVLLGYKKRGFGQGRWNGFGGKVEAGETAQEAAARELGEECRLMTAPDNLAKVGELEFTFEESDTLMDVKIFTTNTYTGIPTETDEMRPEWFPLENIPYSHMWPDDELWYPIFLRGNKFKGAFHFKGHDIILSQSLSEVEAFTN